MNMFPKIWVFTLGHSIHNGSDTFSMFSIEFSSFLPPNTQRRRRENFVLRMIITVEWLKLAFIDSIHSKTFSVHHISLENDRKKLASRGGRWEQWVWKLFHTNPVVMTPSLACPAFLASFCKSQPWPCLLLVFVQILFFLSLNVTAKKLCFPFTYQQQLSMKTGAQCLAKTAAQKLATNCFGCSCNSSSIVILSFRAGEIFVKLSIYQS